MTSPTLSDEQIIERIAVEVMGWHKVEARGNGNMGKIWATHDRDQNKHWDYAEDIRWDPTSDWNDFRAVEEKVMEDDFLFRAICTNVVLEKGIKHSGFGATDMYVIADLPTRCRALLAALDSLPES